MKKISEIIPGTFEAITIAKFIRDNNIGFKRLLINYGGCFCKVEIVDTRFETEVLFVASGSLY